MFPYAKSVPVQTISSGKFNRASKHLEHSFAITKCDRTDGEFIPRVFFHFPKPDFQKDKRRFLLTSHGVGIECAYFISRVT